MKVQHKTRLILKLWMWISLSINTSILTINVFLLKNDKTITDFFLLIFIAAMIICLGLNHILSAIDFNSFDILGAILDYVLLVVVSGGLAYYAYPLGIIPVILIIVALFIELSIVPIIIYRYRIWNFLKKIKRKK